MTGLLVVVGAMVGAPLRYLLDRTIQARHESAFPWGTLAVNVAGSFLLGLLAATAIVSDDAMTLLGVGLCGAFTTYSTFSYETVRLLHVGPRLYAILNVAASVVAGLGAAGLGALLASALW